MAQGKKGVKPSGRPSSFTQKVADTICDLLIEPKSLRAICATKGMPDMKTVMRWLANNESFRQQYARARDLQADVIADETSEIVDDGSNDWMASNKPDNPGWKENGEAIQRSRLRFDQRRWYLSKLAPKKYGDRLEVDATVQGEIKILIGGDA